MNIVWYDKSCGFSWLRKLILCENPLKLFREWHRTWRPLGEEWFKLLLLLTPKCTALSYKHWFILYNPVLVCTDYNYHAFSPYVLIHFFCYAHKTSDLDGGPFLLLPTGINVSVSENLIPAFCGFGASEQSRGLLSWVILHLFSVTDNCNQPMSITNLIFPEQE